MIPSVSPRARRPRPRSLAAAAAATALALAGCGGQEAGSAAADDAEVRVLAAFYPYAFVAERVGGDRVSVENLTGAGAEPHDLELSPRQVGDLAAADLVVHQEGFQPAVDEALEIDPPASVLEVTDVVPLEETGGAHADEHAEHSAEEHAEHAEGEHAEHSEEEHAEHADEAHTDEAHTEGDGHDHSALAGDPHLWLDPTRLATVTDAVAERLAEVDPEGADGYAERAEELRGELTALDEEFAEGLADCRLDTFVVSHAAFGYLADRYGLEQVAVSGLVPEAEPSPSRIVEVQETVREEEVDTIFYETLVSPDVAEALAGDLGVGTAVLDPLEGLTAEAADADYLSVMRDNLAALREANDCA